MKPTDKSPLSLHVNVLRLPRKGVQLAIEADAAQRAALAAAHGLEAVDRFEAELLVTAWKRAGVKVAGRFSADVVQSCVVTLDPLPARVEEAVEAIFVPEGSRLSRPHDAPTGELLLDAEGPDLPEPFRGDSIDVGQLVEEHFALALDPYPRSPGASVESAVRTQDETHGPLHEGLRNLHERD